MHLSFDSLDELHDMIREMGYVRKIDLEIEVAQQAELSAETLRNLLLPVPAEAHASAWTETGEQGNVQADSTSSATEPASSSAPSEPPKRKRRTKAEIEAAKAAEQSNAPVGPSETTEAVAQSPATQGNPFEASTSNPSAATQAILNAPSGQAATLAGIQATQNSPFETAAVSAGAEQADTSATITAESAASASKSATQMGNITTDAAIDPASFVETRSLEILSTQTEPLTAVKHMHLCRDFIARHGQARYLEAFALAGLPATIGTYKPEQCARHQAALEFLALV